MTVGVSKAMIHLFHTEMYHSQQVKRSVKVNREVWQSGGTDLTDAFEKLSKERCDLLVVLTDGYYSRPDVDYKKMPQTVFVIPENCNLDHPIKDLGKTVAYKTML